MKNQTDKVGLVVALLPFTGGAKAERAANDELVHRIKFEIGMEETFIGDIPGRSENEN